MLCLVLLKLHTGLFCERQLATDRNFLLPRMQQKVRFQKDFIDRQWTARSIKICMRTWVINASCCNQSFWTSSVGVVNSTWPSSELSQHHRPTLWSHTKRKNCCLGDSASWLTSEEFQHPSASAGRLHFFWQVLDGRTYTAGQVNPRQDERLTLRKSCSRCRKLRWRSETSVCTEIPHSTSVLSKPLEIKIIVADFGWLKFPTKTIVFGAFGLSLP